MRFCHNKNQIRLFLSCILAATLLGTADAWPSDVSSGKSCGEQMECVPRFLCNNTIVKDGRALINFRSTSFSRNGNQDCPWFETCCSLTDKKPNIPRKEYVPRDCGYTNPQGIDVTLHNTTNGESQFGEFPWVLRIEVQSCTDVYCVYNPVGGGSLLTPKVAVTAAHIIIRPNPLDIKVKAGEWDTQGTDEILPSEERQVQKKILHERFDDVTGSYDVALLILQSPFTLAQHIGTICLPKANEKFMQRRCIVTGWGKKKPNDSDYPNLLKKIDLPTVDRYRCQTQLQNTRLGRYFQLDSSFICAGGEKDKDSCYGDGGAPLACPLRNDPNRYQLNGIVSWGLECGQENVPAVYTNIPMLRRWIVAQLRLHAIPASDVYY